MEPRETRYVALDDGQKLCLEFLNSAIMGTNECQHFYIDIQEFYEEIEVDEGIVEEKDIAGIG